MSCWQLKFAGMPGCDRKNVVQEPINAGVESVAGTCGYPILQVGGEQDAVTEPDPACGVVSPQDCKHPLAGCTTAGSDALHVSGTFVRMSPLLVLGRELIPIMSVSCA